MNFVYVLFFFYIANSLCDARTLYLAVPWDTNENPVDENKIIHIAPRLRRHATKSSSKFGVHSQYQPMAEESALLENRNFNPQEYVDYGAHTGHHGSFGWYADFPVQSH